MLNPSLNAWDDPAFQHYVGYLQSCFKSTQAASLIVYDKSLLDAVAYWDVLFGDGRPKWASELSVERYDVVFLSDHRWIVYFPGGNNFRIFI